MNDAVSPATSTRWVADGGILATNLGRIWQAWACEDTWTLFFLAAGSPSRGPHLMRLGRLQLRVHT